MPCHSYQEGEVISVTSAYPTGALLQDKKTGGVYWLNAGVKAPIWDSMFLKTRFKNKKIISVIQSELEKYPTVDPIRFNDGDLVKSNNSPTVFVIENGIKRPFDSGGHFYPIIAIAEQVNKVADEQKIIECRLYFFSNSPYDKNALFENNIEYHYVPAGKLRLYFSLQNIVDFFSLGFGFFVALVKLFFVYPDIVVGKGGGSSFPTLLAAKVLGIPIMIHEFSGYSERFSH
jgi:hypothetical protein